MRRRVIRGIGGAPARSTARVPITDQDISRWTVTSAGRESVQVATMAHAWEAAIAAHRAGAVVQVRSAAGQGRAGSVDGRRGPAPSPATAPSR